MGVFEGYKKERKLFRNGTVHSVQKGQIWTQNWTKNGQIWTKSGQIGAKNGEIRPIWTKKGKIGQKFGLKMGKFGAKI